MAEGLVVARITITRTMTDDDLIDEVDAVDANGDPMPLTEALGMMRLAENTLIHGGEPEES